MNIFNEEHNRYGSESVKWLKYPKDVIPMWVADSDYAVPEEIITALQERLNHPLLGYGVESEKLRDLIVSRNKRLYNWEIKPEWICFTPGVVASLNSARAIMGDEGSSAITAVPVYPHLMNPSPILNRPMKFFTMENVKGRFTPNFDELEKNIDENTKMLIMCNPHNPVGTLYNDTELERFASIAEKHNLLICSDDIHSDFALYDDKPYRPIVSISSSVSNRSITLMAPSKTFNIAGLNCSFAIIENPELRLAFTHQLNGLVGCVNVLGFIAAEAAFEHGESWHKEQIIHVRNNVEYCYKRINSMPYVSMNSMEATYLAWIDAQQLCNKLRDKGKSNPHDYFVKHGVAVSDGKDFGDNNHFRINLATSQKRLQDGLDRIETSINMLEK